MKRFVNYTSLRVCMFVRRASGSFEFVPHSDGRSLNGAKVLASSLCVKGCPELLPRLHVLKRNHPTRRRELSRMAPPVGAHLQFALRG